MQIRVSLIMILLLQEVYRRRLILCDNFFGIVNILENFRRNSLIIFYISYSIW